MPKDGVERRLAAIREADCENCGEPAGPAFCPHCGQETEARRGPLLAVVNDVLSDWLSLDSRLLHSLRALLRPGHSSSLFLQGKRAPYLRPFRLYLLASLALFSSVLTLESRSADGLDIYIGGELIGSERAVTESFAPQIFGSESTITVRRSIRFLDGQTLADRWVRELAGARIDRLRALPREEIVAMLFSGLRRALPLTLILFVPFLALALKLLYIRGRSEHSLYIDHLVFSLHYQSALFLALSAAWLLARVPGLGLLGIALVYALTLFAMLFLYLPWGLRRFYGQSRRWTALKTLALLFIYGQLLSVVVDLSALIAVWRA